MNKKWQKLGEGNYQFIVDEKPIGEMQIQFDSISTTAHCVIEGKKWVIRRTGFWKNAIEITDGDRNQVLHTRQEKWYANHYILSYQGKEYNLRIRNNPLAEWAITDGDADVLSYGIHPENGSIKVRISYAETNRDWLLDFLLWYLFVPIATENSGDTFLFMMLVAG